MAVIYMMAVFVIVIILLWYWCTSIAFKDVKSTCFTDRGGILIILDVTIDSNFPITSIQLVKSVDQGQYSVMAYVVPRKRKICIVDFCCYLDSHVMYRIEVGNAFGISSTEPIHINLLQDLNCLPPGMNIFFEIDSCSIPLPPKRIFDDPTYMDKTLIRTPIVREVRQLNSVRQVTLARLLCSNSLDQRNSKSVRLYTGYMCEVVVTVP
ncbi:uncharacterized protein LOC125660947 isoform X1 [Ostrea edulis]|uniref:uncharacterized protein LOC125660947 isoform X1 n=1 Tax=Ostrea edulis TaxID=37623 RepID=UPI0024AEEEC5|nr:uncharacterized protein LOC125660947 isoform X1 [Ostrea edulis]